MDEKTREELIRTYQDWQERALDALRAAQGSKLDGPLKNVMDRLREDLEAERDPLPRLRDVHRGLVTQLYEKPKRFDSSYRILDAGEMDRLRERIGSLEAKGESDGE